MTCSRLFARGFFPLVVSACAALLVSAPGCKSPDSSAAGNAPSASASVFVAPAAASSALPVALPAASVSSRALAPLPDGLLATSERIGPPVQIDPDGPRVCPSGMLLIDGDYCPSLAENCLEWVKVKDPTAKGVAQRCIRFEHKSRCLGETEHRRFCIDRFEYPNLEGVHPAVMPDWYDALGACEGEGKRLCLASEWTFACEGREWVPYPYGYERDKRVCNFDRPRPQPEPRFNDFAFPRKVGAEVARLDLRVESGRLDGCVSPFGVRDLTGNVDEWVINEDHFAPYPTEKQPFVSGLKGGYWGPIRARCRPMTTSHNELFRFYQVGFRCCADVSDKPDGVAAPYVGKLDKWRERAGLLAR